MSCVNEKCKNECCDLPAYRADYYCRRCSNTVLTVWYCMTCKHMMEPDGPDHTDRHRLNIVFDWPNPPFRVQFAKPFILCRNCKMQLNDVTIYGLSFHDLDDTGLPSFIRYEVPQDAKE